MTTAARLDRALSAHRQRAEFDYAKDAATRFADSVDREGTRQEGVALGLAIARKALSDAAAARELARQEDARFHRAVTELIHFAPSKASLTCVERWLDAQTTPLSATAP